MKIEVTDKDTSKPFPKLMVYTDKNGKTIILAYACNGGFFLGTCIYTTHSENKVGDYSENKVGEYSEYWLDFKDFEGSITLSNE